MTGAPWAAAALTVCSAAAIASARGSPVRPTGADSSATCGASSPSALTQDRWTTRRTPARWAASSTVAVPPSSTLRICAVVMPLGGVARPARTGASSPTPPMPTAAACTSRSAPSSAFSQLPDVVTSARVTPGARRTSSPMTSSPRRRSSCATAPPRNPAAPVTTDRTTLALPHPLRGQPAGADPRPPAAGYPTRPVPDQTIRDLLVSALPAESAGLSMMASDSTGPDEGAWFWAGAGRRPGRRPGPSGAVSRRHPKATEKGRQKTTSGNGPPDWCRYGEPKSWTQ
ncbi:exported hypothetical protein [Frankia sp. Hr75.2]|nr:exported hypothetical protein [Frankia sp. Hr75.2]